MWLSMTDGGGMIAIVIEQGVEDEVGKEKKEI